MKKQINNLNSQKINSSKNKHVLRNTIILKNLLDSAAYPNNDEALLTKVSNYGHYVALIDGLLLKQDQKVQVSFNSNADLSINQKQGFTLFFWCLIKKSSSGVQRYILKKGSNEEEMAPAIGIYPKKEGNYLFVKCLTSKNKTENMFSNRYIEYDKLYSIAITFDIDFQNDLTDISLYLDGYLDSQISIPGEIIHNQGSLYIGKYDNICYGFSGYIADIIFIPFCLSEKDILDICNKCLLNLTDIGKLKTYNIVEEKLEYKTLANKYSELTGIPVHIVNNMNMINEEFREIIKRYNVEVLDRLELSEVTEINNDTKINKLKQFLGSDTSLLCISIKSFYTYIQFLYSVVTLAAASSSNFELNRLITILEILEEALHIRISFKEMLLLVKIMESYVETNSFNIDTFFINLKNTMRILYPSLATAVYSDSLSNNKINKNFEMHENLLINTQNFKQIDFDYQKDFGKTSFTIKSFYLRNKSGNNVSKNKEYDDDDDDNECYNKDFVNQEMEVDNNNTNKKLSSSNKKENSRKSSSSDKEFNKLYEKTENSDKLKDNETINIKPKYNDNNIKEEEKSNNRENCDDKEKGNQDTNLRTQEINLYKTENNNIKNNKSSVSIKNNQTKSNFNSPNTAKKSDTISSKNQTEYKNNDENILDKTEYPNIEAKYPKDWNMGKLEIIINRCFNCHNHKTTTKHLENTYVEKFNEVSDLIKNDFPNCNIIGNFDDLSYYGQFDVYIRGVGPIQDDEHRCFLFSKYKAKRFPNDFEISDKLIALSMLYGGSINMELTQSSFLNANKSNIKPSKHMHDYPAILSNEGEIHLKQYEDSLLKKKNKDNEFSAKTKLVCSNWGCNIGIITKSELNHNECVFHPGVFQFGSYHGYWPEAWSCCEQSWESPGCQKGSHRIEKANEKIYLCTNIGEQNPKTGRPDSACGVYYTEKDNSTCLIHPGHLSKSGFTCCGNEGIGCQEGSHTTHNWPDEKAKLYFYPKILNNPGLNTFNTKNKKEAFNTVAAQICKSGLFKAIKPYQDVKSKMEIINSRRDKEKTEDKLCLNWGCNKSFRDTTDHNLKNSCRCHPGKFDHGSSGSKMESYIREIETLNKDRKTAFWEPHWTCCRKEWNHPGCKLTYHKGKFPEEIENSNLRPYIWPDVRAKLYFEKTVSDKWRQNIKKYVYSEYRIKKIFENREGNETSVSSLPSLCDEMKLYLILIDEKPDYHLKFNDVVYKNNSIEFFEGGRVTLDKFMFWWFSDYADIINQIIKNK